MKCNVCCELRKYKIIMFVIYFLVNRRIWFKKRERYIDMINMECCMLGLIVVSWFFIFYILNSFF